MPIETLVLSDPSVYVRINLILNESGGGFGGGLWLPKDMYIKK